MRHEAQRADRDIRHDRLSILAPRLAVLLNPVDAPVAETTLRDVQEAARATALPLHILNASTNSEIDAAFAALVSERADALFVASSNYFHSRRVQLAVLAARYRIPVILPQREFVEAGGFMSYGTDITDSIRQVGIYAGKVLKGAKPADLPVAQSTKFEFVINLQTARSLGIDVPATLLTRADKVIE